MNKPKNSLSRGMTITATMYAFLAICLFALKLSINDIAETGELGRKFAWLMDVVANIGLVIVIVTLVIMVLMYAVVVIDRHRKIAEHDRHVEKIRRKIETGDFYAFGERVILTEPDETYSIGTIINYNHSMDSFTLRLEESTHYPQGSFEGDTYIAPRCRIKKMEKTP